MLCKSQICLLTEIHYSINLDHTWRLPFRFLWSLHPKWHKMILRTWISLQPKSLGLGYFPSPSLFWYIWHALFLLDRPKSLNGIHCLTAPKDAERTDWRTDEHRKGIPIALSLSLSHSLLLLTEGCTLNLSQRGSSHFSCLLWYYTHVWSSSKLPDTNTIIYWCVWLSLIGQGLMSRLVKQSPRT